MALLPCDRSWHWFLDGRSMLIHVPEALRCVNLRTQRVRWRITNQSLKITDWREAEKTSTWVLEDSAEPCGAPNGTCGGHYSIVTYPRAIQLPQKKLVDLQFWSTMIITNLLNVATHGNRCHTGVISLATISLWWLDVVTGWGASCHHCAVQFLVSRDDGGLPWNCCRKR